MPENELELMSKPEEPVNNEEEATNVREKVLELNHVEAHEDFEAIQEELVDFINGLREKYPNYVDFAMYHALLGSSPKGELKFYDFPEEDSVAAFVKGLDKKYLNKEEVKE